jgi:tetratricopeptide (TPR) repeat protein
VVKEHQRSLGHLNAVHALEKSNTDAWYLKGMNLKEMKDTPTAITAFQYAFEADPSNYDAAMQLGILYSARRNKLAVDYYNACLRLKPKSDEAYFNRAWYYQQNRQYRDALKDYQKVIMINPSHDMAYYNVGYIHFELRQLDEALRSWNICIQMNPENVQAYYMRGLVHEIRGNKPDARLNYEYVLKLQPDHALAREGLKRTS